MYHLQQLPDVDRLHQVAVEAGRMEALAIVWHGESGQGNNRDLRRAGIGLKLVEGRHAIHAGQLDVH
jgi:hypothetical protein